MLIQIIHNCSYCLDEGHCTAGEEIYFRFKQRLSIYE